MDAQPAAPAFTAAAIRDAQTVEESTRLAGALWEAAVAGSPAALNVLARKDQIRCTSS